MVYLRKLLLLGLLLPGISAANMETPHIPLLLDQSKQLIIVTAANVNTANAKLQLYERRNVHQRWKIQGSPFQVSIGKHGMAFDNAFKFNQVNTPIKRESDFRSPIGVFAVGPIFGFAQKSESVIKMPYLPISNNTVCIDDQKSVYYNQILNTAQLPKNSWRSGEYMNAVPGYEWGVVVQYNMPQSIPDAGSCIFIHIKQPADNQGTAGCVAMPKANIQTIIAWLDPAKKPVILILPQTVYQDVQKNWKLPKFNNLLFYL